MKFQWGNSLLRQGMGSITPLQSSSDLYTAMTGLQSANFDKFSPANNPLLQAGAASGDMASKALLMNANTNKAVNGLSKSAANMATGTAGSTVKPGGGLFSKANISNTMSKAGGYADMIGSFIPKKEQSALTTSLNQGYDAAANMISSVPGVGTIVGGAMKIGGMLSDGLTALGVGTDQMTTTDKILDSKFMKLTPMGLVNAFGAKKADTIYKDNETWEQQGSAYGGSMAKVDDALTKSGKKYGAFSGKARRKANAQIAEAKRQQNLVSDINQEAQDAFAASNYSGIGLRNELALSGGYRNMAVGRNGMKILDAESQWAREVLTKAREVNKLQKGGKVDGITGAAPKITFESWYETVPSDRNDTTSYNLRRAFELAPKEELEAWRTSSVEDLRNGKNHLNSVYLNPKTGIYEFMKAKNHPTLKYELEWYNSKDPEAIKFRNAYDLDMSGDYYKYVPKKFAEGGTVNVIPDGALHAHKHHLEDISPEYEQVTSKGIPVVTEEEGGKLKQHAEIERNEIIFRLEVTKKLEELMKDGSDDAAIEAGKLLAHEIINNTVDNTGLMEVVE
mgnify:FL=1